VNCIASRRSASAPGSVFSEPQNGPGWANLDGALPHTSAAVGCASQFEQSTGQPDPDANDLLLRNVGIHPIHQQREPRASGSIAWSVVCLDY